MVFNKIGKGHKVLKLLAIFLMLTFITSLLPSTIMAASTNTAATAKRGNSMSNLNNGGTLVQDGEWLYYVNEGRTEQIPGKFEYQYTLNPGLFAKRLDGTGEPKRITDSIKEKLNLSRFGGSLNVMDGWIYYMAYRETKKNAKTGITGSETIICRVPSNGNGKSTVLYTTGDTYITNVALVRFSVINGWIYYSVEDNSKDTRIFKLFRMRQDGKGKVLLTEAANPYFDVGGEWIYYGDYSTIMRMKLDGTKKKEKVYNSSFITDRYTIDGDWLYFNMYGKLCRVPMKKDVKASEVKEIATLEENGFNMSFFMVYNGWVYYTDILKSDRKEEFDMPSKALYRSSVDGKKKGIAFKENDFWFESLQIIDGWLYSPNALTDYNPGKLRIKISDLK